MDIELNDYTKTYAGHPRSITYIKKVPDHNEFFSGSCDGSILLWNIETGKCIKMNKDSTESVKSIVIINSDKFVTCFYGCVIKLFEMESFKCIRLFIGHENNVCFIDKISKDELISCSEDGSIRIWNLNSGECLKVIQDNGKAIYCGILFSEDTLICGRENEIQIWNFKNETCLKRLNELKTVCIFKLSNEKIATAEFYGNIKIWNINTGECLITFETNQIGIFYLAKFSKNSIICCNNRSTEMTAKVWNINSGCCLKNFQGDCIDLF